MSEELITPEEAVEVLDEAIELIKEPASWTTGKWKCDMYEADKDGRLVKDKDGKFVVARDLYNRPLSQYCIEGAVNQAVYNKLGEERAIQLGAFDPDAGDDNAKFSGYDSDIHDEDEEPYETWPTDLLGIDELARQRYEEIVGGESRAALTLNDFHNSGTPEEQKEGHKKMLGLLKARRTQIKKSLFR